MRELVDIALSQYGIQEKSGSMHNPVILHYFKDIGHKWVTTDETAWCSAFMNWVALKANCERSGKLYARSWLGIGTEIEEPQIGDLVIFWREGKNSWKGHVAIFINFSQNGKQIHCLGGNQNNKVCIKPYPIRRLLGYRRLQKITSK